MSRARQLDQIEAGEERKSAFTRRALWRQIQQGIANSGGGTSGKPPPQQKRKPPRNRAERRRDLKALGAFGKGRRA